MKLIEQYGKKKVMLGGGIAILVVILMILGIQYQMKENHKKEILASLNLTFKEDAFIEYGQEEIDFNEFVQEKQGDPEIVLPDVKIDTKVLGKQEVTYTLKKGGYDKEVLLSIEVKDTKAPEIVFKQDSVEIMEGDEFDSVSNIESVKDPIDGDIERSEEEKLEKNGYLIKSDIDTDTPSDYKVMIIAFDVNGNKSEKEYEVLVKEKLQEQKPITNNSGTTINPTGNSSSGGGNTSSNGGGTESNTPSEPYYRTDIASTYVAQINAYRQQNGYDLLPVTEVAQAEANRRAMELVTYYSHDGCGKGFSENIGNGDIGFDFFTGWINSPSHNGTILDDWWSAFAVSVVEYNGKWYAVTSFKLRER